MMHADAPTGFFGKLPARGDFLRADLPRSFTDPLDLWLQGVLSASRETFGDDWGRMWDEAPGWCFALPAGACGPAPAIGVMLPSRDAVGRGFPLIVARLGAVSEPDAATFWALAEVAGRTAIAERLEPDGLRALLREPGAPIASVVQARAPAPWTALPAPAAFAALLEAGAACP